MLYDQVAKDLYRVALYTLGNPQDAEDVVSETFLEAYKGLRNLRDDSKFKAWIMRIPLHPLQAENFQLYHGKAADQPG